MDASTRRALNAINRRFYTLHAEAFAQTRDHGWPGWQRAWRTLPAARPLRLLDVGCGNGRFGAFLSGLAAPDIEYTGVDASRELVESARERTASLAGARLVCVDWEDRGPQQALPRGPFEAVVAFGVLHHVPGTAGRRSLLEAMAARLVPGGVLVATFWRFGAPELASRYAERRLAWQETTGPAIDVEQLEAGDQLLQWGDDPAAQRYCHYCDDAEIEHLVDTLGLERVDSFASDGRSHDLNRYEILRRSAP